MGAHCFRGLSPLMAQSTPLGKREGRTLLENRLVKKSYSFHKIMENREKDEGSTGKIQLSRECAH